MSLKAHVSRLHSRSLLHLLMDLRLHYSIVSASLTLLGFFWNNLEGFDWSYMALIFSIFCANVFGFVVNDFYDSSYDLQENNKKNRNVFCSSNTKQLGKGVLYGSLGFSLILSGLVSSHMVLLITLFNLLAFVYSAPPIRLRSRLYWDWIFIFLWKGLIIFMGYFYFFGTSFSENFFIVGTVAIVLVSSLLHQIQNQIRDFTLDNLTNTTNSVQHLGFQKAVSISSILLLSLSIFSLGFCYLSGLYVTMISILLNVSLYYFVNPKKTVNYIQFSHLWIVILFLEWLCCARFF